MKNRLARCIVHWQDVNRYAKTWDAMKRKSRRRQSKRPRTKVYKAVGAALKLHRAGRLAEAKQAYEQILRTHPDCAEALYLLGVLFHSIGSPNVSIDLIRRAIALQPDFAEAQNDLGNVLHEAGQLDEAASVFRQLIRSKPQHADACNNLGVVLKDQGKHEEAVTAFKKAIQLNPKNAGQHYNLGNALKKLSRFDEAVAAYRSVIDLEPSHTDACQCLAATLRRTGKLHEYEEALRHWLEHDSDNPIAQHLLIACSDGEPPSRAPDAYVRQVFDRFANTFDEELRELGYQGPQLLDAAISQEFNPKEKSLDVLEAGCGTGQCGAVLRGYARKLVGVDLSPAMLDRARRLDVYDELVTAELTAYLNDSDAAFDLIASVDTMNYFGDLKPVLSAMTRVLHDDGCVVFTCEEDNREHSQRGYRLGHHGRYGHTADYLRRCLAEAGLTIRTITSAVLRKEANQPVVIKVVRARKNSAQ